MIFFSVESLNKVLDGMELPMLEIPKPALFLSGKAFLQYRRSGSVKNSVLGNFFIGAHDAISGLPVLRRNPRRYKNYFPSVKLVTPAADAIWISNKIPLGVLGRLVSNRTASWRSIFSISPKFFSAESLL